MDDINCGEGEENANSTVNNFVTDFMKKTNLYNLIHVKQLDIILIYNIISYHKS